MSDIGNIINNKHDIATAFHTLLMVKLHCKTHPNDPVITTDTLESMMYMFGVWTDEDLPETIRAIAFETFGLQISKLTVKLENALMENELKRMNAELN